MRNALGYVSKTQQSIVAGALRQASFRLTAAQASEPLHRVADQLRTKWPKLAAFIERQRSRCVIVSGLPGAASHQVALDESARAAQ
jgi:hypothetical protein